MKVRCEARYPESHGWIIDSHEIKTMDDYYQLRRAVVGSAEAYFNGFQIVKFGGIIDAAYNRREEILDFLLGNRTLEELNEYIEAA